uniref:TPX2 C-terminal domain-containing protein n=1 Tax=Brassica oleracea var. oleracea TaxID=109376 RepID=A0A0D3D8W0_BRAOL
MGEKEQTTAFSQLIWLDSKRHRPGTRSVKIAVKRERESGLHIRKPSIGDMDTTTEEQTAGSAKTMIDETYDFTAPQWYNLENEETKLDEQRSELWFESATSYDSSPSIPIIKARRSFKVESMCQVEEESTQLKAKGSSDEQVASDIFSNPTNKQGECSFKKENNQNNNTSTDTQGHDSFLDDVIEQDNKENIPPPQTEVSIMTNTKLHLNSTKNRSVLMPIKQPQARGANQKTIKRETNVKKTAGTSKMAQENQAIKRQKLDGGKSKQILNPRPITLPHKTKQGLVNTSFNLCPSITKKTGTENRKVYVREQVTPFVSTAELMKKFQTSTRDLSLPHVQNQSRPMTLTRLNEPEFATSQRTRPVRLKSTSELEEEMLAKIPKFKARPLNKKILEAPALSAPQRSIPHFPVFKEFHLKTMARASQHAETSSVVSTEMSKHNNGRPHITEPKSPLLQTMLRARPIKAKTSTEIEHEELKKVPKFRARPFNKKIFESKGEMGIFCNTKKHVTIPQEFHFLTDERISQPNSVIDLFDKLSLYSESCRERPLQRTTTPNPFLLRTEERGAEKEKKFVRQVIHKQTDAEKARTPKATPYPYTTDYPVFPPKPESKQCTKPEPFKLESVARHEEEMRKEMEERMRMEREEAQRRVFRAQPIQFLPVPEKARKPLTAIQEFNLHVDDRAVERADFDHKIKEKEMMYKRYREETEAAKMVEEERALKQLRRTMVPQARPVPNFNNLFYLRSAHGANTPGFEASRCKQFSRATGALLHGARQRQEGD